MRCVIRGCLRRAVIAQEGVAVPHGVNLLMVCNEEPSQEGALVLCGQHLREPPFRAQVVVGLNKVLDGILRGQRRSSVHPSPGNERE